MVTEQEIQSTLKEIKKKGGTQRAKKEFGSLGYNVDIINEKTVREISRDLGNRSSYILRLKGKIFRLTRTNRGTKKQLQKFVKDEKIRKTKYYRIRKSPKIVKGSHMLITMKKIDTLRRR